VGLNELDDLQDDRRQVLRLVNLFAHIAGPQFRLDLARQFLKQVEYLVAVHGLQVGIDSLEVDALVVLLGGALEIVVLVIRDVVILLVGVGPGRKLVDVSKDHFFQKIESDFVHGGLP
jgi:hypothetical protein